MSLERRFAIIVGTNCYDTKKLQYTLKDAGDMRSILQKRCEFNDEDIIKLEFDIHFNGNIQNTILNAFTEVTSNGFIKNMHTFLFYYSGHGIYDKKESKSYLELSDNEKISIQEIFDKINELGAKNSFLIVDACNAGGQLNFTNRAKNKLVKQLHYNSKGIYCLFGSTSSRLSYEPTPSQTIKHDIRNGYLTHFLIEAIETPEKYTNGILGFSTIKDHTTINSQIWTAFDQIPVFQTTHTEGVHPFAIWKDAGKFVKSKNSSPKPEIETNYQKRIEEVELIKRLEENKLLLLTGISKCGKSAIAKSMALHFWEKGYIFKLTDDYAEASRFLNTSSENRICLLEDPLGHVISNTNSENLHKIEDLIGNIPSNGKLIVCSRSEVLKNINSSDNIADWRIDGHDWINLTLKDCKSLVQIWNMYCKENAISPNIQQQIITFLEESDETNLLQIGQLRHLAKTPTEKLENQSVEYLCHLARADAKELAKEIVQRGLDAWKICVALTLTSNTIISVNEVDLKYILSDSDDLSLYGFIDKLKTSKSITFGSNKQKLRSIPNYPDSIKKIELDAKIQAELYFLEERGYVTITNHNIVFSHPQYKEMANYVLITIKNEKQREFINCYIRRALATCSPQTAFLCAKQLSFIHEAFKNKEKSITKNIILNAKKAISRSFYPSVRDQSATFLIKNLSKLESKTQKAIFEYLKSPIDDNSIIWYRGVPIFSKDFIRTMGDKFERRLIKEEPYFELLKKLKSNEIIKIEEIWNALSSLRYNNIVNMSSQVYLTALNANEVFVRAEAALLAMEDSNIIEDWRVVEKIFSDEHPAVVCEGIKGSFIGFSSYSPIQKEKILPLLKDAFTKNSLIIRANSWMMSFATDYSNEGQKFWGSISKPNHKVVWSLWGELFPIFLYHYPIDLRIPNTGRYSVMFDKAIEEASEYHCLKVAEATLTWIGNQIKIRELDSDEMCLVDFILKLSKKNEYDRFDVFKGLFEIKQTIFTLTNLSWSISNWDELTDQEKIVIIDLLKEERIDKRWIHAVACVQYDIPSEIQQFLFNDSSFFSQETEHIVQNFDKNLLSDCLIIFTRKSPFGAVGNNGGNIWMKILKHILQTQFTVGFEICLRQMLYSGVGQSVEEWKNDGLQIWAYLCHNISSKSILVEALIAQISICSPNLDWTTKLWAVLIKAYQDEGKENDVISIIATNIEAFSSTSNEDDLFVFFEKDILNKILGALPSDLLIFGIIDSRKKQIAIEKERIEQLVHQCKDIPVRFWLTFDMLYKAISDNLFNPEEVEKLRSIPNNIELKEKEYRKLNYKKIHNYTITDLISYRNF